LTLLKQRELAAAPPSSRTATPTERRRKNRREGKAAERAAERAHNRANRKRPSAVRRPKGSGATAAGAAGAKRVTSPSAGQAAATT
ncbi:MAG: hypothetical protein M3154_04925, partial [Candidatus Eremiobacteraeota bacterium]|nr:hypothetical protein [Candidatus Eremiobacteraeota bacterium]